MKELTLKQLSQWSEGDLQPADSVGTITGMQHDSRKVKAGDLFVALPGSRADGHDFVESAWKAGAVAALVCRPVPCGIPQIVVDDTLKAYGRIAKEYRAQTDVSVVAITGSVGKTTTKEMISCILSGKYRVSKTRDNHNNDLGLPITIMDMPADTQMAVLELGMNHFGEMAYLTSIARPNLVVITNIGTMHIEHLGTREGILRAKLEIMEGIHPDGVAVFNGDEPLLWNLREGTHRRVYFGIENERCDVIAEDLRQIDGGVYFTVRGLDRKFQIFVPQEGRHMVYNALAAVTVGLLSGVSPESIQYQLGLFRNTGMRQNIFEDKGFTVIEDCYNAGPESMEAALRVLGEHKTQGHRIAVLGDMLELGSRAMAEHYRIGRLAAGVSDLILAYGEHSVRIITGAITGGMNPKRTLHFDNQEDMLKTLKRMAKPGDVLLFKGSRGMHMEEVLHQFLESKEND